MKISFRFLSFSKRNFFFVIFFIQLSSSYDFAILPEDPQEPCQCQADNSSPVCGTNGITYDNFCKLRCDSRFVPALGGKCRGRCPCPAPSAMSNMICELSRDNNCPPQIPKGEICGTDNVTYPDSCQFMCAQQSPGNLGVQCGGACPCPKAETPCSRCPEEYRPMCGTNGITYGNQCMFACARMSRPDLFPKCRTECPCLSTVGKSASEADAAFTGHLKQAFLVRL